MAAAGAAAAAAAPGAQAADEMTSLDDTCLECAGIGIVPCKLHCLRRGAAVGITAAVHEAPVPGLHAPDKGDPACMH